MAKTVRRKIEEAIKDSMPIENNYDVRQLIKNILAVLDKFLRSDELLEKLAELEHSQWSHWTRYMLENLSDENIKRWRNQIETEYSKLSEKEKESDREWALKVVNLFLGEGEAHA